MEASEEVVRMLAQLSRLELESEEISSLQGDLEEILNYCEQLKDAPVDGVAPLAHPIRTVCCPLFDDEVEWEQLLPSQEFLAGAPDHLGKLLRVPAILEEMES